MLIAIEGIDGAGKSTQTRLLAEWLENKALDSGAERSMAAPLVTKWNSSPLVKPALKDAKKHRTLTPLTFALLEAADLADRYDREIRPALHQGRAVIADRWVYTAFARGHARGMNGGWLHSIYSFAPTPDLCFYLEVPVSVALDRIQQFRRVKHYEAGMDIGFSDDPDESFCEFQAVCCAAYTGMQRVSDYFTVIDAQLCAEEQHEIILQHIASGQSAREAS